MADVGLRVNEVSHLDLADVKWDLGRFGKLHVRLGKGARGSGPRERMVPLINGAGATLRWFVQDVWSSFDDDHARPGALLFCSERRNAGGSAARAGNEKFASRASKTPSLLQGLAAGPTCLSLDDADSSERAVVHAPDSAVALRGRVTPRW